MNSSERNSTSYSVQLPLYVIKSKWTINEILDFLLQYGSKDDIRLLRIDRFKNEETNRTIAVLTDKLYSNVKDLSQPGFSIAPYKLKDTNFPRKEETTNLFLSVPKRLPRQQVFEELKGYLHELEDLFDIKDKYQIKIPLRSREQDGRHSGMAFINFKESVPVEQIAGLRVALHDVWFHVGRRRELVKCFWARTKNNRTMETVNPNRSQNR